MAETKQQRTNDLAWDLYESVTGEKGGEKHQDIEEALKFALEKKVSERSNVLEALGEASVLFMSQEVKGTEMVMPTEDLIRIANSVKQ